MLDRPTYLIGASIAIAALAVLAWRARRLRAQRCRVLGVTAVPWAKSRVLALAAALGLLAITAAGTRWRTAPIATAAGHDITFVIDTSHSMLAKDAMPDRLARAKELAGEAVAALAAPGGNRVAVTTFASQPRLIVPLTYDLNHVRTAIAEIEPSADPARASKSGTRIGAALEQAVRALSVGRGGGLVLLFSDGDDPVNDGEWLRGAEVAVEARIPIGVIGIGDAQRESSVPNRPEARTRLRDALLQELATRTGGQYMAASAGLTPVAQFTRSMLADRPRMDDPTLVTARAPANAAPVLTGAIVLLALGLVGMQWRIIVAAAAVATIAAGPVDDWLHRGNAALAAGQAHQALDWYAKAEGRAQDPGLVAFNQGVALATLGRYREAELHFQWCLSDATGERRIRALYNLGTCLVRRGAGRDRAALQAAVASFQAARDAMNPTDSLAENVRENLALAHELLAQLPPEQAPTPGDGESHGTDKSSTTIESGQSNGSQPQSDKNAPHHGNTPNPTDQVGPPGRGNLPPLADIDELQSITPQDLDHHLRRVVDRVNAAKRDRLRSKFIDRPVPYPDW